MQKIRWKYFAQNTLVIFITVKKSMVSVYRGVRPRCLATDLWQFLAIDQKATIVMTLTLSSYTQLIRRGRHRSGKVNLMPRTNILSKVWHYKHFPKTAFCQDIFARILVYICVFVCAYPMTKRNQMQSWNLVYTLPIKIPKNFDFNFGRYTIKIPYRAQDNNVPRYSYFS